MLPFGPVTVLIGRNGAGKSSVLEALGFTPTEEGALERRDDEPPRVSWYRSATDEAEIRGLLAAGTPLAEQQQSSALRKLITHMVIRESHEGGLRLSFDLFRSLLDHPHHNQRSIRDRLVSQLGALGTDWGDDLAARVRNSGDGVLPFLDFGPSIPSRGEVGRAPFRPRVVSMTTVPDDISPSLMRGVRELAGLAYSDLAVRRADVGDAVDALAHGRLRPLHDLGLLIPVIRLLERRANFVAPSFVSGSTGGDDGNDNSSGLLTIDLLDAADTRMGNVIAQLLDLADRSDDTDTTTALVEIASALAGSGESFDMHLDCSLVNVRKGTPHRFAFSRLGTGTRRWVCGAIDEAVRDLCDGLVAHPVNGAEASLIADAGTIAERLAPAGTAQLRLIDEPLESLESGAHSEVLAWLRSHASSTETLVLSSHHPSALRAAASSNDLEVIGLDRIDGNVRARIFGPSLLKGLQESFADLGLRREDLLFNARALLLLEGPDDLRVLDTIFGDHLYEMGVLIKAIGGTAAPQVVAAFSHSGYELLGLQAWAMWDGTRDESVPVDQHCESASRATPTGLQRAAVTLGPDRIRLLPFEPADICLGLTPHCFELAFPRGFVENGVRLGGDDVLRRMQRCESSTEAKTLLQDLLLGERRGSFSQNVMTPVLSAIRHHGLERKAANRWLRSSMSRLIREVSLLDS